mmetsp:Transcript_33426/g.92358  ORF Transcript_33426/g.92358 Transcript_33426/m.92358 type:complete len:381 (-) Transcript_33426:260-1402(-)|eukprot:CAMPEP_0117497030 /NCGR_PEP_ID=MMETSP0784-20121206/20967_1 /TAXON_ID=39447 /ORGANISM="" /LENGTH=380 /DNA_ID=CAMNT_0005292029 /DNA_START=57 /DNA_END=1199 /DNA_ORIENTATION=-
MGNALGDTCTNRQPAAQPESCFYLNFKILNFEEAFPALMQSKLEERGKGKAVQAVAGKVGALLASRPQAAHGFTDKITSAISRKLPEVFAEMGIDVELRKVFSSIQWVVLRAEVKDVDIDKLLRSDQVDKASIADRIEPFWEIARKYTCLPNVVREKFQAQFKEKLEKTLPAKMWKKTGFEILLVSKESSEQAEFFFDNVQPQEICLEYKLLGGGAALQEAIDEKWKNELGSILGSGVAKVAGKVAKNVPEKVLVKKFGGRALKGKLVEVAYEAGINVNVAQVVVDDDGTGYVNMNVHYIDTGKLGVPAEGGIYFRLSHAVRAEVLAAACARLEKDLLDYYTSKRAEIHLHVTKGHKSTDSIDADMDDDDGEVESPPGVY